MAVLLAANNRDYFLLKPLRFEFHDDTWVLCDLALVINAKELLRARRFTLDLLEVRTLQARLQACAQAPILAPRW